MITVNENKKGISNLASPYRIPDLGEVFNKNEKRISCSHEHDCGNQLYYRKGNRFAGSRVLKQIYEM